MNTKITLLAASLVAALSVGSAQVSAQPASEQGVATGTVNTVDAAKNTINLTHGPIPALGWPAMTMDFGVAPGVALGGLAKDDKVSFTVAKGKDGAFRIIAIKPAAK